MQTYMVLLADRKRAKMFTLLEGVVERKAEFIDGHVPQNVKHGDNRGDAPDKIFRHIEEHLHRHLTFVGRQAINFSKGDHIAGIIIGGHKPLFAKIEKHLPYPLSHKVKGRFISELKGPFNEILKRAKRVISQIENESERTNYVH